MTSTSEIILLALTEALNAAVPALVYRGLALPTEVPPEGLLIVRDGSPGEPAVTMSPLRYHFEHVAEIEMILQGKGDVDARFDELKLAIAAMILSDRTLGGLCDWVEPGAPEPQDLPFEGAESLKAAIIPVTLHYVTVSPLS
jgi:hypothetical protein